MGINSLGEPHRETMCVSVRCKTCFRYVCHVVGVAVGGVPCIGLAIKIHQEGIKFC
jgi:hypothetical protein